MKQQDIAICYSNKAIAVANSDKTRRNEICRFVLKRQCNFFSDSQSWIGSASYCANRIFSFSEIALQEEKIGTQKIIFACSQQYLSLEKKKDQNIFDTFATWVLNLELNILCKEWKTDSWLLCPLAPPFVFLLHQIASQFMRNDGEVDLCLIY